MGLAPRASAPPRARPGRGSRRGRSRRTRRTMIRYRDSADGSRRGRSRWTRRRGPAATARTHFDIFQDTRLTLAHASPPAACLDAGALREGGGVVFGVCLRVSLSACLCDSVSRCLCVQERSIAIGVFIAQFINTLIVSPPPSQPRLAPPVGWADERRSASRPGR